MKRKCHDYLTLLTSTEKLMTPVRFELASLGINKRKLHEYLAMLMSTELKLD